MALNFPLNPSDGDTYQGYVYDATDGVWNANQGQIVSRFSTSATQPDSPSAGDGWFNPANGKTYIYYDGAWVESGNPVIGGVEPYDKQTSATGYFALPSGTTAQRPDTPKNGDIRFNTTLGEPEYYSEDAASWFRFREIPSIEFVAEYLIIAGGGGGGGAGAVGWYGGGGGAGGYRSSVNGESSGGGSSAENALTLTTGISYDVAIGAGGSGGLGGGGGYNGTSGGDTLFSSITSVGGGGGGFGYSSGAGGNDGKVGGSGGGSGSDPNGSAGGSGTASQGYSGGNYINENSGWGGTGGGAGSAGISNPYGSYSIPVSGGSGVTSSITGSAVERAKGGRLVVANEPGGPNTGTGGSTYATSNYNASAGGSGVVIIKYPSRFSVSVGAGLTASTTTIGEYKVTTFTAGTDTVTFS